MAKLLKNEHTTNYIILFLTLKYILCTCGVKKLYKTITALIVFSNFAFGYVLNAHIIIYVVYIYNKVYKIRRKQNYHTFIFIQCIKIFN